MSINVQEKKQFLNWLVSNVSFHRREVSWILNYLANHEAILANVHFVENAAKTNRGLVIRSADGSDTPVLLTIEKQIFQDTDQIFHEIRMNWKKPLYLECIFPSSWENPAYLAVLEDNPFDRWNDHVDDSMKKKVEQYFVTEEERSKINSLYHQIDLALENGDRDAFLKLSDEVNRRLLQKENPQR